MARRERESATRLAGMRIRRNDYSGRAINYQIIACGVIPDNLSEPVGCHQVCYLQDFVQLHSDPHPIIPK
uniref:Uncharacterized protein n=1 Tax=Onchocerca volvulus TaxID=6282 RepID=A0A8R1Y357_ONCVO